MTKEQILDEESGRPDEMLTEWVTINRAGAIRAMERYANQKTADLQTGILNFSRSLRDLEKDGMLDERYERRIHFKVWDHFDTCFHLYDSGDGSIQLDRGTLVWYRWDYTRLSINSFGA